MVRSLLQFWEKDGQIKAIVDENLVITSQFGYCAKFSDVPLSQVRKGVFISTYWVRLCTHIIHCILHKN